MLPITYIKRSIADINILLLFFLSNTIIIQSIFCSSQSSQQKWNHPRSELSRQITSGEEAWLASIKNKNTHAKASSSINKHNDNNREQNNQSRSTNKQMQAVTLDNNETKIPTNEPRNHQKDKGSTRTTYKKKFKNNKNNLSSSSSFASLSPTLKYDLHTLSNIHGLNESTPVDRVTYAKVRNLAHDGSNDSMYLLGFLHLYGLTGNDNNNNHVTHNNEHKQSNASMQIASAVDNFHDAAVNGHADAQCALGLLLYDGVPGMVGRDRKSAMRWFYRASIDSDSPRGHLLLGRALLHGMSYEDIGISMWKMSDQAVDSHHISNIDDHDVNTTNTTSSRMSLMRNQEAARLFELAAKSDIAEAIHHRAVMFEYGIDASTSSSSSISINSKDRSMTNSSMIQDEIKDQHNKPNFAEAIRWYRRSADLGYAYSWYNLGLMHLHGRGVIQSYPMAKDYFKTAALRHDHSPSMRYLGLMAMRGYGQPNERADPNEAAHWFDLCMKVDMIDDERNMDETGQLCKSDLDELLSIMKLAVENYSMNRV